MSCREMSFVCEKEAQPAALEFPHGEVKCDERLGGLLKHYRRQAA